MIDHFGNLALLKTRQKPDVLITVGPCKWWNHKYEIRLEAKLPNGTLWAESETWPTVTILPFRFHCWWWKRVLMGRYRAVVKATTIK